MSMHGKHRKGKIFYNYWDQRKVHLILDKQMELDHRHLHFPLVPRVYYVKLLVMEAVQGSMKVVMELEIDDYLVDYQIVVLVDLVPMFDLSIEINRIRKFNTIICNKMIGIYGS